MHIPLADRRCGWYQEILPMAGQRWTDSTEALIRAAHDQALSTRLIEAGFYHTKQDSRCRLCNDGNERIRHITGGCNMLAGRASMERHNQVAGIVQQNVCAQYGLEVSKSKWDMPTKVIEYDQTKDFQDFQMQMNKTHDCYPNRYSSGGQAFATHFTNTTSRAPRESSPSLYEDSLVSWKRVSV